MNKNKHWVGCDLDDVLANMREKMVDSFNRNAGTKYQLHDWTDYNFYQKHMTQDQFLNMIIDENIIRLCKPDAGVVQAIADIKEQGLSVAVITARGYHPQAREFTQFWFKEHGLDIDELIITGSTQSKADVLCELPPLLAYVDDHPGHLNAILKKMGAINSPKLYLMDRPWNQDITEHHRISNIDEFKDVVFEKYYDIQQKIKNNVPRNVF